jgi:hypothetical protein
LRGLFGFKNGALSGKKHPHFSKQKELAALINSKLGKVYGSSETNIDKKLGEANRILASLQDPSKPGSKLPRKTQAKRKPAATK